MLRWGCHTTRVKVPQPPIVGRHLVIVHDIDSGVVNGALGAWKRLRGSDPRRCSLCALTRGVRGINPRWQAHLDSLSEPVHTLTRDQFWAAHASSSWRSVDLPVILVKTGPAIEQLVSAAQIRDCTSIGQLTQLLDAALRAHPA